jgi:predicted RNase H-like nuclease (RuvC/YqgF family)
MAIVDVVRRRGNEPMKPESPKMPRAPTVPAAPPTTMAMPHYDEEVLRVAQRDYDNKRMIAELERERDEWRRKALSASEECRRLEMRLDQEQAAHSTEVHRLTEQRDRKIAELTQHRDQYGHQLTRFETKLNLQGKAIIDLANSVSKTVLDMMNEIRDEKDRPDVAGNVGLAAIADAIEDEPPIPRVVAAGPRHDEGEP